MLDHDLLLVILVRLVDRIPCPGTAPQRRRGRPTVYADRLFLKALVIMIARHLRTVHELLAVLAWSRPTVGVMGCPVLAGANRTQEHPTLLSWLRTPSGFPVQATSVSLL